MDNNLINRDCVAFDHNNFDNWQQELLALREQVASLEQNLQQRDRLFAGFTNATRCLLTINDYHQSINKALAALGQATLVDRIYIFRNHSDSETGELFMSQVWEWVAQGITPEIDNPQLQNLSYREFFPSWQQKLAQGQSICGLVKDFPEQERFILESQDIRSILVMPITIQGQFWGLIGFDDCKRERVWLEEEKSILEAAVSCFAGAITRQKITAQWQESQQFLQLVMDNIPQLILWKDRNLVYLGCNQNTAQVAGFKSPEEIVGKTDYDLPWTPEEADWYRECDRLVMDSGQPQLHIIETQQQIDGRKAWLDTCKIPLRDPQDHVVGILVTIEDITERKQAEDKLQNLKQELEKRFVERTSQLRKVVKHMKQEMRDRKQTETALSQSQAQLQAIINNAPAIIYLKDLAGNYLLVNREFEKVLNLSQEEIIGKNDYHFLTQEVADQIREHEHQAIAAGQALRWEESITLEDSVHTYIAIKFPLFDSFGRVYATCGISTDITENKQVEVELAKLSLVASQTDNGVVITDRKGLTEWVNEGFTRITGYDIEHMRGQKPGAILQGNLTDSHTVDNISQALQANKSFAGEIINYHKNGQHYWISLSINPIFDDNGKLTQFVAIQKDISQRKQAEAKLHDRTQELENTLKELRQTQLQMIQSEKMSSLGQMVAGIAHEINNPVNFIHGNLAPTQEYISDLLKLIELYQKYFPETPEEIVEEIEFIDLDFLKSDLPKILESMRLGTKRIREIVLSLRNFSRLDEAEFKRVDIHEGIDSTLLILQNRLNNNQIEIIKEYTQLPLVECYPGQLNQVFMNILTNAIESLEESIKSHKEYHKKAKMPQVCITTELKDDWLQVKIADNGKGITEEIKDKIFDPFFSNKPVGKGTGLGLSISYQIIIDQHGGSLYCESLPEEQTTFVIEVPLCQAIYL